MTLTLLIASCNRHISKELKLIDDITFTDYTRAETMLDSFTQANKDMKKSDFMYCKLIRLRIADKAYRSINKQKNQVDSLVNYFEGFHDNDILAESYFMAGRVYYELGDSPEALSFYQKAESSVSKDNYALKGDILYQMAAIYRLCHLDKEAINTLKKAFVTDSISGNKQNMLFDIRDIGLNYFDLGLINKAESYYKNGLSKAKKTRDDKMQKTFCHLLTVVYMKKKQYKIAEQYLKPCLEQIDDYDINKSGVYSTASMLYHQCQKDKLAEKYDLWLNHNGTIWAKKYITQNQINNAIQKNDYKKIPLLWNLYLQQTDSITKISDTEPIKKMEQLYNYEIKVKDNAELSRKNTILAMSIVCIIMLLLMATCTFTFAIISQKQKRKNIELKLENYKSLKEKEKEKLKSTKAKDLQKKEITNSKIFNEIQQAIKDGSFKLETCQWKELEELVEKNYPEFRKRLNSFVRFSDFEFKVCLMIKVGISPSNIGDFTSHSKEGINSARGRLFKKAFNKPASAPKWDEFIKSL